MASSSRICLQLFVIVLVGEICNLDAALPLVINTWPFTVATDSAWTTLVDENMTPMDALIQGCTQCEEQKCEDSIGYGGHPDEKGETTLDAMVMDGPTHGIGAVGSLRRVKWAISVARAVLERTKHTLLVGDQATDFAVDMGFTDESLTTNASTTTWEQWEANNCQPNFRTNVIPDPTTSCGPYRPANISDGARSSVDRKSARISRANHDTIGMVVIGGDGTMVTGTTTNGAQSKVPGRVGDSPIPGSGAYCDQEVGGAAGTGDGDVMMRFLPSYQTVENMRNGMSPDKAAADALQRIIPYYPTFSGALVAATTNGTYGAACYGIGTFQYAVRDATMNETSIFTVTCIGNPEVYHQH